MWIADYSESVNLGSEKWMATPSTMALPSIPPRPAEFTRAPDLLGRAWSESHQIQLLRRACHILLGRGDARHLVRRRHRRGRHHMLLLLLLELLILLLPGEHQHLLLRLLIAHG